MRRRNVALRLLPSLLEQARQVAKEEGAALNQLINVAVAEKLSALRTEQALSTRTSRADCARSLETLARIGRDQPPVPGDELP